MNITFEDVLGTLSPSDMMRVVNAPRPMGDYLFQNYLPNRMATEYTVEAGSMTVRATMAGAVGMDSPYPPVGLVQASKFLEKALKIGAYSKLTEENLRKIQNLINSQILSGNSSNVRGFLTGEVLNFLDKVIGQSMYDRLEWLRAQALVTGAISWTFNKIAWSVSYGVPTANILTQRTSTAAWDSTASAFWTDIGLLYAALRYNVEAFIVHPDTLLAIVGNSANNMEIIAQESFGAGGSRTTVRRLLGDNERASRDFREQVTLIAYGDEAEIFDTSNPGQTTLVPFMPTKKILAIGRPSRRGYVVGQGGTEDPDDALALGYTHIGPTVEGNGAPGLWAQVYTPEHLPMQLHGRGAGNVIPVLENPDLVAVASSEIGGS